MGMEHVCIIADSRSVRNFAAELMRHEQQVIGKCPFEGSRLTFIIAILSLERILKRVHLISTGQITKRLLDIQI